MNQTRCEHELYPNFTPELNEIKANGINPVLLTKIIEKHTRNAAYNKDLYDRYKAIDGSVPIQRRQPRFKLEKPKGKDQEPEQINNKINNDFFGEIIDFKVGYFAGRPISYSYSHTKESKEETNKKESQNDKKGGFLSKLFSSSNKIDAEEEAIKEASKGLSDYVTRNNMYDVDMEVTKMASITGYSGRLMYHDLDGNERVMMIPSFETIILSSTNIMEPEFGVRYYKTEDINGSTYYVVEFYDDKTIKTYEGQLGSLELKSEIQNLYSYCPLQGIPNNNEMIGDAEKVLSEIDAYDRIVSDSSNQIEGQVNSKEIYENVNITREEIALGNYTGAIQFHNGTGNGKIYKLETNINDNFVEHTLGRLEGNIYRFSKTPNLNDQAFAGNATGVALKFKLTGLEAKCGMFQAKMQTAGVYMFKLLASALAKKGISIDPLQCVMGFSRNFPLDTLSNAQAAQALIGAGLPKKIAWDIAIPEIDDVDYVMEVLEEELASTPPPLDDFADEEDEDNAEDGENNPEDKEKDLENDEEEEENEENTTK